MTNLQIAELLRNVASCYQLKDSVKYKFQIIAYERAADAIEHATSELKDLWDDGKLEEVPGIGPSLAKHLDEIFKSGKSKHFEEIMNGVPSEAFRLMALPKVGIKTAIKILIESPQSEIEEKLKEADRIINKVKRHLLPYAQEVADEVIEWMKKSGDVITIDPLGSLRRKSATVGDIDIAVATNNSISVIKHFVDYPKKQKIIEQGEKSASIMLPSDIQVDILPTSPESYGNTLQHFTGSKHHNIKLRELALKKNLSLNEYRAKNTKDNKETKFSDEKDYYNFLGMDFIPPELREDSGEIEMAINHKLPKLIELKDVKADLQIHSDFDIETSHDLGVSNAEEIIKRSEELGYEYIAFTDHNPSKKGHMDEDIVKLLREKRKWVDSINEHLNYSCIHKVFNSLEIDINKDGSLPVPEAGLATLDFALVSIHSSFDLPRSVMTERVLRALSNPKVKIFAHPTARKINEREGVELDWDKIFDFCVKFDKWIEINADPMRLDLPDVLVREAVKKGVKLTLGTDTHEVSMMDNMQYGVNVARRGWAENLNIINTKNLQEFKKMLL